MYMAHQKHVYSWGAYGASNHGNHAKYEMYQDLLICMRKLWGSPHEQCWKHHMEKMDNIQNNAYPKLGGHGMAYEINDAKGAYQYHRMKTKANNQGLVVYAICANWVYVDGICIGTKMILQI